MFFLKDFAKPFRNDSGRNPLRYPCWLRSFLSYMISCQCFEFFLNSFSAKHLWKTVFVRQHEVNKGNGGNTEDSLRKYFTHIDSSRLVIKTSDGLWSFNLKAHCLSCLSLWWASYHFAVIVHLFFYRYIHSK